LPWSLIALLMVIVAVTWVQISRAEIFHSKESALRLAFPQADSIAVRDLLLDKAQAKQIAERSGVRLDSRMVTIYEGLRNDEVCGVAFIETHKVRSLPETILIVLEPDGRSRAVHLLAFHEPPEYMPPERWLAQFQDRALDAELALRRGIAGMAGSTLTATAITAAVRKSMAVYETVSGRSIASARAREAGTH
jgi:hypothetical protein